MRYCPLLILFLLFCCHQDPKTDQLFSRAGIHAKQANEGFIRANRYMRDWLTFADPATGLIPRNLYQSKDIWNAQDAAADNYPFMVLTAALTDQSLFKGRMMDMLISEERITSRIRSLPDTYSFTTGEFLLDQPDTASIIFGSSEYIKDGLLPLTEWLGPSPWSDRMVQMMDDIWEIAPVSTKYGKIPSLNVEVNGEMLQALCRIYWMTSDEKYLDWAIRLGDYYLLGDHHPTDDFEVLRLRDHGCEIVSGLCELYATVHFKMPSKKQVYQEAVHRMLDRILETGINEHGMFYNNINPQTGEKQGNEIELLSVADTWGYTYNGFYTVWLIDGIDQYRQAVIHVLNNLGQYRNYDWESGSADGYADAIESALNLYNREHIKEAADWIDSETGIMWSMQDSSYREGAQSWKKRGIIEGWHGDGNFARTTLMYCLWKTQGVWLLPWSQDVIYGAEKKGESLLLSIEVSTPWKGRLFFDKQRYKEYFHLPVDYPRINQFPEWFTVNSDKQYRIIDFSRSRQNDYPGEKLSNGISINLKEKGIYYFKVEELKDE